MKRTHTLASSLAAAALALACPASAADYYVSPKGNDSNDGRTPQTAFSTLGKLTKTLHAGDTGLLEGGQTFETTLRSESGTLGKPIAFQSYGNGQAKIIVQGEMQPAICLNGNHFVEFRNLDVSSPNGTGILIRPEGESHHIAFDSLNLHHCKVAAFYVSDKAEQIIISNCSISDVKEIGIFSRGESIAIKGSKIKVNSSKPAIGLYGVQKAELTGNTIEGEGILLELNPPVADYKASGNIWLAKSIGDEVFRWGTEKMSLGRLRSNSASKQHKDDKVLTPQMRQTR